MSLLGNDQATQALMTTELSKHQSKELIPTSEMLDITISVVYMN